MLETVVRFFQEGGPFMYPIAIVLAVGLAITVERFIYLASVRQRNRLAFEGHTAAAEETGLPAGDESRDRL